MDEIIAKFTEASALQCFSAFVSLVWLVGMVGLPRGNRKSASAEEENDGPKNNKE